jgi:hypothetical protein
VLSYTQKPLITLPALYGAHKIICLKEPNQLYKKQSYLLHSTLISLCQICLHVLSVAVFYTTPLTPHLAVICHNKTKTLLYRFVYGGSQCHCAAEQQLRCTVLTVGSPTHCMTPVTQSHTLHDPSHTVPTLNDPSHTVQTLHDTSHTVPHTT